MTDAGNKPALAASASDAMDIVDRLRRRSCQPEVWMRCGLAECTCRIQADAAAEIERLRKALADEQPGAGWEARG